MARWCMYSSATCFLGTNSVFLAFTHVDTNSSNSSIFHGIVFIYYMMLHTLYTIVFHYSNSEYITIIHPGSFGWPPKLLPTCYLQHALQILGAGKKPQPVSWSDTRAQPVFGDVPVLTSCSPEASLSIPPYPHPRAISKDAESHSRYSLKEDNKIQVPGIDSKS